MHSKCTIPYEMTCTVYLPWDSLSFGWSIFIYVCAALFLVEFSVTVAQVFPFTHWFRRKISLRGQRVLVTGGARGIGREMALLFAKEHAAEIVLWDIKEPELQQTGLPSSHA